MIEIDDAGSGSLIGGTGIGLLRQESGEYIFKVIPIKYFQNPHFSDKKYQHYVIKIVAASLKRLHHTRDEMLQICPGYIFDALRVWLNEKGYTWENKKIVGELQERVEQSFSHYVIDLGLPPQFVQHARYAFGFHRLFKWVMADYPNRNKLCKTGWKSWNKWSQSPLNPKLTTATQERYCLKCGQLIKKNMPIIRLEYITNQPCWIELHRTCWSIGQAPGEYS